MLPRKKLFFDPKNYSVEEWNDLILQIELFGIKEPNGYLFTSTPDTLTYQIIIYKVIKDLIFINHIEEFNNEDEYIKAIENLETSYENNPYQITVSN